MAIFFFQCKPILNVLYFEKEFLLCSLLILTQLHINSDATHTGIINQIAKIPQQIGNLSTENSLSNELNIFQWPISLFTAHQYSSKDVEPSVKKSEIKRNLSFSLENFYFDVFVFFNRDLNDFVKKKYWDFKCFFSFAFQNFRWFCHFN